MIQVYLLVGAALFSIGAALLLTRRNAIVALMGLELMLNAVNLNLVAFSRHDPTLQGHFFALFVMVVAAAEVAVALALVIRVYQHFRTSNLDELHDLKG